MALALACGGEAEGDDANEATGPEATTDAPAEPAAELTAARGTVEARHGEASYETAAQGRALYPLDLVRTGGDSEATVTFATGGAVARMGPESVLRIPAQHPQVTRLHHSAGQLFARASGPAGRRVEVELPPGTLVLESQGATEGEDVPEAQVDVGDERVEVAMLGGEGTLRRTGDQEVRVEAGRYIAVDRSGQLLDEGLVGERVTLSEPAPGAQIRTRTPVPFTWREVEGATGYRIEFEGEGAPAPQQVGGTTASVGGSSGSFRWRVRALRGDAAYPPSEWRVVTVDHDTTAPELRLTSPRPGQMVTGARVRVSGRTEPGARVAVDGRALMVREDGTFSGQHPVRQGLSNLVVSATDDLGNRRVLSRSVLRR